MLIFQKWLKRITWGFFMGGGKKGNDAVKPLLLLRVLVLPTFPHELPWLLVQCLCNTHHTSFIQRKHKICTIQENHHFYPSPHLCISSVVQPQCSKAGGHTGPTISLNVTALFSGKFCIHREKNELEKIAQKRKKWVRGLSGCHAGCF